MKKTFTKFLAALMLLAIFTPSMIAVGQTNVASFSRSGSSNTTTGGDFTTTFSAKTGYYQDNNGDCYMQILNTSAYWTTTPTSISFAAKIGGGSANRDLTNAVYVSLLDQNGDVIASTQTSVTAHITTAAGDDYTISIPVTNNVYGVKLSHEKESGYNVRYYSFSLSYVAGGVTPTTYTVTFDAGDGTFVGNTDFPSTSNTVAAGTYTLPSATAPSGYTFNKWNIGDATYDAGDSYTVSDNADFVASYTQDTPPTPVGDLLIDFESAESAYTDWTFDNMTSQQTGSITAHGGTYYGTTGGKTTASITTKSTIATPYTLTCYVSKQSTNTTSSTWYIQVSSDGSTWTNVESRSATDMTKGDWKEFTANLTNYTNVYVRVYYSGSTAVRNIDDLTLITSIPSVIAPTFSPAEGLYSSAQNVTISTTTTGATIYYTTDGSDPTTSSSVYSTAIPVSSTTTIKAMAVASGNASSIVSSTYTIVGHAGTEADPYTVADARTAIDAGMGVTGVYVTGIVCTASPQLYNNKYLSYYISADGETTSDQLEAYNGLGLNSANFTSVDDVEVGATVVIYGNLTKHNSTYELASNNYLVSYTAPQHEVEAPTFNPAAGTYTTAQTVSISTTTSGATIYYTLDGTEPTNASTEYTTALNVSTTTTIKAVAYDGTNYSNITTANYHFCSATNPYTVTEALAFLDYPANGIYVTGIVSTAPAQAPTNNGELTYYISVDGEAANQLEVYKGLGLNEAAFTTQDDIQVGDIVTVYGNVVIFGTTNPIKEFAQGNYLVSFEHPTVQYDLTVSTLSSNVNGIYVFDANDQSNPLIANGAAGTVQVSPGTSIMISPDIALNYGLASLTVGSDDVTSQVTGGEYTFTMPAHDVTISATAALSDDYELYSEALVEGDYLIVYDNKAMNNIVISNRLQYAEAIPNNGIITTAYAAIVWHIAPSETDGYWTIYSADAQAYAASTGTKNQATTMANGTDDKALWSITVAESKDNTYEFVNKNNYDNNVNHLLRNNGTYGFACYATSTGGALSLYKKAEPTPTAYTLDITGYNTSEGGYVLIASPVTEDITPSTGNGFFTSETSQDFDLYRYNPTATGAEWENWKQTGSHNHFTIETGRGYLYASKADTQLSFTGTLNTETDVELAYTGYNLIGNSSNEMRYISGSYYIMNSNGTDIILSTRNDNSVNAMEGIVVNGTAGATVTFSTNAKRAENSRVILNIINSRGNVIDRAIVSFDENGNMPKFMIDETNTKIYFPQSEGNYAIVSSNGQGTMPVNFKAKEMGMYTISVETEGIDLNSLHLIDRLTGEDVNLLIDSKYSFIASNSDMESRFILSFGENGISANGNETFAFQNGNDIIVNGEGELQVFDVMGRMVSNAIVNGVEAIALPQGVYIFRLNENIQKIVVR